MRPEAVTKERTDQSQNSPEPFSLLGTLEEYEVEELSAREIAGLMAAGNHRTKTNVRRNTT